MVRMIYIGARSGNSLSLSNAFERKGVIVKHIDPETLVSAENRVIRLIRTYIDKFLNLFDSQPLCDPIMRVRNIRRLRRDRMASIKSLRNINKAMREYVNAVKPDITFLFHNHYVNAETLELCHRYGPVFCFFPDDAFTPERYTLRAADMLKHVDLVMSTKSFNIPEFRAIGIPIAIFVNNSYDPNFLYPVVVNDEERVQYGCDVSFVGNNYIRHRADFLARLVEACPNIKFGIWGNRWTLLKWYYQIIDPVRYMRYRKLQVFAHSAVSYAEICKIHAASKINLGLLYAGHGPTRIRDYQTTRSVEIPATGGFMLAEYTDEHAALFAEGKEAIFFKSFEDLVAKINHYVYNNDERIRIAAAGLQRCQSTDYTFDHRAQTLLDEYFKVSNNFNKKDAIS